MKESTYKVIYNFQGYGQQNVGFQMNYVQAVHRKQTTEQSITKSWKNWIH